MLRREFCLPTYDLTSACKRIARGPTLLYWHALFASALALSVVCLDLLLLAGLICLSCSAGYPRLWVLAYWWLGSLVPCAYVAYQIVKEHGKFHNRRYEKDLRADINDAYKFAAAINPLGILYHLLKRAGYVVKLARRE